MVGSFPVSPWRGKFIALWVALACGYGISFTWPSPIAAVEAPPRQAFDKAVIERGARLADIGGCVGCHTVPGGMPYAGGVPLATLFGTIYGTNITPHPLDGIGGWPEQAFDRAMREGIDRDGRHLYPAFPYPHFTMLSDEELHALYAYIMTRTPVQSAAPTNDLRFPFNVRSFLVLWNALYLRRDPYRADPAQSAQWNRGAYLVQSLGHCGVCHSPHDALGAEDRKHPLAGGTAEGWYAPPLNERSPSPLPWTVDQLTSYLRQGIADQHAIAGGPMQGVVQDLAQAPADDVRAMAVYIVSLMGATTHEREARTGASLALSSRHESDPAAIRSIRQSAPADPAQSGPAIYHGSCAGCHEDSSYHALRRALRFSCRSRSRCTRPTLAA